MDFAGHLGAFVLAPGLQASGQCAKLLAGVLERPFRGAFIRDVPQAADEPNWLSAGIPDNETSVQYRCISFVLAPKVVFIAPRVAAALDGRADGLGDPVPVLGVNALAPPIEF